MILEGFARLGRGWKRHGWRLFGPLIVHNIRFYWKQYRTVGRFGSPKSEVDSIPGVETHRAVYLTALNLTGDSASDACPYEPSVDADLLSIIAALPIAPSEFVFVDLGSGKGRALLLAAKIGFKRIIGVEYSADLHQAAKRNMAAAQGRWPSVECIELVCGDAADYDLPDCPLVCYLYNPFGANVMSRVIAQLVRKLSQAENEMWVVYGNPTQSRLFEGESAFERAFALRDHVVYTRRSTMIGSDR